MDKLIEKVLIIDKLMSAFNNIRLPNCISFFSWVLYTAKYVWFKKGKNYISIYLYIYVYRYIYTLKFYPSK